MLAGRYRIIGLLGRGGMGEVYRADDLTLGVPVALKFLSESLTSDAQRVQRFLSEVRIARQISHPNVCRVFDVGELMIESMDASMAGGSHGRISRQPGGVVGGGSSASRYSVFYLSMEFVDGEDLSSLLRRIGRLPEDKAIQTARQVCAGLAAAHDQGIIHRDLKPANIMLDGRGKARIMDFGVAGIGQVLNERGDIAAGTPAYMAPEQLAGKSVSVRSDIYSLGLVLYELFTGKPVWAERARTLAELRELHETSRPDAPSSLMAGIDPIVETVILRCIDPDPAGRPASALSVAASLPGGDPLAAALAAGETPSPEMVAASGSVGVLKASTGVAILIAVVIGLAAILLVHSSVGLMNIVRPEHPTVVMVAKARDVLTKLGYGEHAVDEAYSFASTNSVSSYHRNLALEQSPPERRWYDALSDARAVALSFWYRSSPESIRSRGVETLFVEMDNPPQVIEGSARVMLDTKGRLVRFDAVPPRMHMASADDATIDAAANPASAAGPSPTPDWAALFGLAELDMSAFTAVEPIHTALSACDARAAWEGEVPTEPPIPVRVEAASERGRPVFFRIYYPWSTPDRQLAKSTLGAAGRVAEILSFTLFLAAVSGGASLAWRNVRAGRHDRKGSAVVGLGIFALTVFANVIAPDRFASIFAREILYDPVARGLWLGGLCWLFYTAFEPIVRRIWPNVLVSWTRLLSGRIRDPLVGRDVLYGLVGGLWLWLLVRGSTALAPWLGEVAELPNEANLTVLRGFRAMVTVLLSGLTSATTIGMLFAMLLIGAKALLKRRELAVAAVGVVIFFFQANSLGWSPMGTAISLLGAAVVTFILVRAGLLATIAMFFASNAIAPLPLTADPSAWHLPVTLMGGGIVLGLAIYGMMVAVGGQRRVRAMTV